MNIRPATLLKQFCTELSHHYDEREADAIAKILLQEFLNADRAKLMINDELQVDEQVLLSMNEAIGRLKREEPLQHILGKGHFYGRDFIVNSSVLIPRPETEELVDLIISKHRYTRVKILDIGTGTGCIPITLACEMPDSIVFGLDVSKEALETATKNAEVLSADVTFFQSDILTEVPDQTFDVVVSNPPYITHSEKKLMHANVTDYEPGLALFVPDSDPLLFYRSVVQSCRTILKSGGSLYFEINEHFGNETLQLLVDEGYQHTQLIKDLSGKDRIVSGVKH